MRGTHRSRSLGAPSLRRRHRTYQSSKPTLDAEADAILAKSDEEIMADAIIEYGNEKGASAAADAVKKGLLLVV
ncbi:hypothetical protein LCGC14_1423920, partial [marine sediment metagenome]